MSIIKRSVATIKGLKGTNYTVANHSGRDVLDQLIIEDRVLVLDDGDGKWAIYGPGVINEGKGSNWVKMMDQDVIDNGISPEAIKQSYESNDDTNAFTDDLKIKLEQVSVEHYTPAGRVSYPKEFNAIVTASDGAWTCDYAIANFTKIHSIQATAIATGTANGDRRIACISSTPPSLTECSGALMSATSAGLLAAMTLVSGSGEVYVTVKGE